MVDIKNGSARAHAVDVIKDLQATQHQKLDAILFLLLSDHDRIKVMEEAVSQHPFAGLQPKHASRVWSFLFAWFVAVSVALGDRVWFWLKELGVF